MYEFTKGIPLERFDNTKVQIIIKDKDLPIVGKCTIDEENYQIEVRGTYDDALWVIDFDEIINLRFVPSGLVHDHYHTTPGDMIHVPEKGEWTSYGHNKVL